MMSKYHISKILNNNVIICINSNQEVILIGKGIGFNKKPGMVGTEPLKWELNKNTMF